MKYFAKVHHHENEKLLAICDAELMGREFEHKGLSMTVLPRFYGELEYSEEEILIELKSATSINVMGSRICDLMVELSYLHPKSILWIETDDELIGHAIVVK